VVDFQDWRDDICLVYGKTYARVRTAEVRRSINRPLLKSHVNGEAAWYAPRTCGKRTRTHAYRRASSSIRARQHRANPREKFARLFAKERLRGFHNSLSISTIDSAFFFSFSLSLSLSLSLAGPFDVPGLLLRLALRSIDLPYLALLSATCFRAPFNRALRRDQQLVVRADHPRSDVKQTVKGTNGGIIERRVLIRE